MTTIFRRYVDDPTTQERELHERSGQPVERIGPVFSADDVEDIPMQQIRFADGYVTEAFVDELTEEDTHA